LTSHPERDFPYFGEVTPLLEEGLLIPFYVDGEAVGTIWVVAHDESRRFDAEDLRVMTNLGTFAASAYIDCSLEKDDLLLTWKEHGGPSLNGAPADEGFGTMITRRLVTHQFGGRLCNDWEPDGLVVHISVPVARLKA